MALPDGLYDQLLTDSLARSLAAVGADRADVAALNAPAGEALAEALHRQLAALLDDLPGDAADKAPATAGAGERAACHAAPQVAA
jgi:ABC-type amino acid transport substrate-binding protein